MLGWVIRALLFLSGILTGLFMSKEAHQYPIMQMMVAIFLFVLLIGGVAAWPWIKSRFVRGRRS